MVPVSHSIREIIFAIEHAPEGGYVARALGASIHTQAQTVAELHGRVRDAVSCHIDPGRAPAMIRLKGHREELLPHLLC